MSYDDFIRYLEAKQSVDQRALNRNVWESMTRRLALGGENLRLLELGAGHGAMVERFAARGLLEGRAYTAVDSNPEALAAARRRFECDPRAKALELIAADLYAFAAKATARWDLVIAHALLDLLDLERALPAIRSLCAPHGSFYFTINFDGETVFEPTDDRELDAEVLALYHRTMDERMVDSLPSGHSKTGRRLFAALHAHGAIIDAAGSSDWVVWPRSGRYPNDEAYFLHFIVATIGRALAGSDELGDARLRTWLSERHRQIARGELTYVAHQLDFFGHWS